MIALAMMRAICGKDFSKKYPKGAYSGDNEAYRDAEVKRRFMFILITCHDYKERDAWVLTEELAEQVQQIFYS